jgi:hypothetical protein
MEKEPAYLSAMLTSQTNLHVILGVGALAVLAAFPFGLAGAALPLLALGAGEIIASLVIPDLPRFRAKVNRTICQARRDETRTTLLSELAHRIPLELNGSSLSLARKGQLEAADRQRMSAYNRMIEQIQALTRVAQDHDSSLGENEIERLHEATLDFLSLWLARLVISAREGASDIDDIHCKLAQIEQSLPTADRATATQLRHAQVEYQGILDRRSALAGKTMAIDAALAAMPDKIDEIYQMIIAAPYSKGIDDRLEDSLSRLRLAEELQQELSLDLSDTLPSGAVFDHASSNNPSPNIAAGERTQTAARQATANH